MYELNPPFKAIWYFIHAAKSLSFSKAADTLCVTHSAVSQQIKLLETLLGQSLFNRQAGKVQLTAAASEYAEVAEQALMSLLTATRDMQQTSSAKVLRVRLMTSLSMNWLIPQLPAFQRCYPDVECRISTPSMEVMKTQLDADISIVFGAEKDWHEFAIETLFDDQLILVGNPRLIDANLTAEALLAQYPLIVVDQPMRQYDHTHWLRKAGLKVPAKKQLQSFDSTMQALQAVVAGLGVFVTHKPLVRDYLRQDQLRQLTEVVMDTDDKYFVICHNKENACAVAFRDWLFTL